MVHKDFFNPVDAPYLDPEVERRVVLITGANSGLGWYTVLHLYLHGYVIYVAGRSLVKVHRAMKEVIEEANNRVEQYTDAEHFARNRGEIHIFYMDLSILSTVVEGVKEFRLRESKLHILINNAGVMALPFELTKNQFEIQYQVNYLSHFLLTQKLLPALLEVSDDPSELAAPRIVSLSSIAHHFVPKHFDPMDPIKKTPNFLYTWIRYGRSKMNMIYAAQELTRRYPDILSIAVHPGIITNTPLFNYLRSITVMGPIAKQAFKTFDKVNGITAEEGCLSTLRAVMDPTLTAAEDGGQYFVTGGIKEKASKLARNPEYARLCWKSSFEAIRSCDIEV